MAAKDRFGNDIDPELSYAKGSILNQAEDQYEETLKARRIIKNRWETGGIENIFNFSGLERGFPGSYNHLKELDDEIAPAIFRDKFTSLALDHFGGNEDYHDAFLANRLTAATISTFLTLVEPGQTVIGVAPNHSHASVVRAAELAGAEFIDVHSYEEYLSTFENQNHVGLIVISRMDVTYDIFDEQEVTNVITHAKNNGKYVYMDDAGGARVAPALFDQPKSLELEVDVVSTGLDKYGVFGPRFGLMGGKKDLVSQIRSKAWKLGLEARPTFIVGAIDSLERYDPDTVKDRYEATLKVRDHLKQLIGDSCKETSSIVYVTGEEILQLALDRSEVSTTNIVPIEATGAHSMLLLRDYGIITVHFVGIPSGTPDLLLKFLSPDEIERFGGAKAFAEAIDESITELASIIGNDSEMRKLLIG